MLKLNAFTYERGKPMVYSLASASRFLSECKHPLIIRTSKTQHIKIVSNCVCFIDTDYIGEIGVDSERFRFEGNDAVAFIYINRRIINSYFKGVTI